MSLQGTFTAIVTPMNHDGSLDLGALDALVDTQLAAGISGLVPCGTTGETATLSEDEQNAVIGRVVKRVAGKVPVIAGAGSNATNVTIANTKRVRDLGASHALIVAPYYNKPTQDGIIRHYSAVTNAVDIPIVAYNVPGRTASDIKAETVIELAKNPRIVAIKDATSDLDRVTVTGRAVRDDFTQLSGEDATACAFTLMGGHGVVSVISNVVPAEMVQMIGHAQRGEVAQARQMHAKLRDLTTALFWESNPIPAKAALVLMGRMQNALRLPLVEMTEGNRNKLRDVLKAGGWL